MFKVGFVELVDLVPWRADVFLAGALFSALFAGGAFLAAAAFDGLFATVVAGTG